MKKLSKVISVLLAAVMVMSMVTACGSNGTNSGTNAENNETNNAANGTVLKVGGIGPTTGSNAVYGLAVKNAAQLAIDEINAAGGINGLQLELNFQDDEADPEKSINAYNTLKDWGMQMLMGTVTSGACIAVVEKTNADNMFQLSPSGSAVECIQYPNAFRICFSDPDQGSASAKYIGENNLAEKVAVIYDSSSIYSSGIYAKFAEEAKNQNFEIVAAEAFTADSNTDFSVQLQKAKDAGADMIFLPIYYTEASLILTQSAGMDFTFFGCDGLDGILNVENFDVSLAENVILLTPFAADATDELTQNFVKKYQENFGGIPNQFAADAYDAMYTIKAAAEKAGITADMSVSDICEAMKTVMLEISVDGLTSSGMTWTENGEPNKAPKAVKIVNGVYTAME